MSRPAVLAVVPARGGSKGVPRKNIRPLGGRPLIAYTIEAALASTLVTDVVVTTDDAEIRDVALACGAQVPFLRPAELATDGALAVPTIRHAALEMEALRGAPYDVVAMLQPTTPLRTSADIDDAIGNLLAADADAVISVIGVDNWHPMKMKVLRDGWLLDYAEPPTENPPRQSLPPVYMVNGAIYATRRDVLVLTHSFKGRRCLAHHMPAERSVNIDTLIDFKVAEWMLAGGD